MSAATAGAPSGPPAAGSDASVDAPTLDPARAPIAVSSDGRTVVLAVVRCLDETTGGALIDAASAAVDGRTERIDVDLRSLESFTDAGALDLKSLERLIGFYVEASVHGITVLGMMGEAQKLTPEESRLVIQRTLQQVAGELPVVVGVSNSGLTNVAALTGDAMSLGAAAVMVAPIRQIIHDRYIHNRNSGSAASAP